MNATVLDPQVSPALLLSHHSHSSSLQRNAFQQVPLTEPQRVRSLVKFLIEHFDWTYFILTLAFCTAFYVGCLVVYRLYLSPVASIPGPFWAKISSWYEFYYDYVHVGKYYERIREMHYKYGGLYLFLAFKNTSLVVNSILIHVEGPIVRVTPEEVHILDPPMYHKLFVSAAVRKTNGYARFWDGTGFEGMSFRFCFLDK